MRVSAAPMRFKDHRKVIAVALERLKLSCPLDEASAHRRPVVTLALLDGILAMAVTNAVLGQKIVTVRIWNFSAGRSVAGVPVQHKRGRLHCGQAFGGL